MLIAKETKGKMIERKIKKKTQVLYLKNHEKLTAVMVLTSQTLIVPSNDAVANKSGLSGLNLQSNMVSMCP